MTKYKWELGTYFTFKCDFKEAITTYVVQSSRNLKLIKNDKQNIRLKCKKEG